MTVSKAKQLSNKKHDSTHFKYQSVKLKITEYDRLKQAVEVSGEKMNGFLRAAIMDRVEEYVPEQGERDEASELALISDKEQSKEKTKE